MNESPLSDEEYLALEARARQASEELSVAEAQWLAAQDRRHRCLRDYNDATFELREAQNKRWGLAAS